jgi:low molecular weight protein-tyrosine phosphatase
VSERPSAVLFVCTANVCRSPMAQLRFERAIHDRGIASAFTVGSAGVQARRGMPMLTGCAELVDADRAAGAAFRSRPLSSALVRDSAAVVAMTRVGLSTVLSREPRAIARSVTLAELARCARTSRLDAGEPARQLAALVRLAIRVRGATAPLDPADDDIDDPVASPDLLLRRTAANIVSYVDTVVASLCATAMTAIGSRSR